MSKHPKIQVGDWITVGSHDCVVSMVFTENLSGGVCMVVFDQRKPTTRVVEWGGDNWAFQKSPDYGGYARDSDYCVQQLKRGRYGLYSNG